MRITRCVCADAAGKADVSGPTLLRTLRPRLKQIPFSYDACSKLPQQAGVHAPGQAGQPVRFARPGVIRTALSAGWRPRLILASVGRCNCPRLSSGVARQRT